MILLDAGDALFRVAQLPAEGPARAKEAEKAKLIVDTMGRLGYAGMAVGERDIALGVEELKKLAAAAKLPLLAANLEDSKGKKPFVERRVVPVGAVKVGVFAVSNGLEFQKAGLKVLHPLEVAQAQAAALRKEGAEFVVALLHLDYDASLKLTNELKGVDFAIQSHDGRVSGTQLVGSTLLVAGGERGRQVGRAKFTLAGKLPYFDLSGAKEAKE
ncbi:MAG: 5'-nucleotidase, partial [Myxococcales bacterium]